MIFSYRYKNDTLATAVVVYRDKTNFFMHTTSDKNKKKGFTPLEIWAWLKRLARTLSKTSHMPQKAFYYASLTGFTMVEVVVMLAIITTLSAIVLASFGRLNEGAVLRGSVRETALVMRKAQNMSLSVRQIMVGAPPQAVIPPAVGVRFTKGQSLFFLFADLAVSRDFKYTDASEKIGTDERFLRKIYVKSFKNETGTQYTAPETQSIHVIFSAPEATVAITNANGVDMGNFIEIELAEPSGQQTKSIAVRTSGQISIK